MYASDFAYALRAVADVPEVTGFELRRMRDHCISSRMMVSTEDWVGSRVEMIGSHDDGREDRIISLKSASSIFAPIAFA